MAKFRGLGRSAVGEHSKSETAGAPSMFTGASIDESMVFIVSRLVRHSILPFRKSSTMHCTVFKPAHFWNILSVSENQTCSTSSSQNSEQVALPALVLAAVALEDV